MPKLISNVVLNIAVLYLFLICPSQQYTTAGALKLTWGSPSSIMRGFQKHANNNRALVASSVLASILAVNALETSASIGIEAKKINLGPTEISKVVGAEDISERQALITADFSRDIYSENCKFQDEIDVYPIDQYVKVCIDICYTSFSIRALNIVFAFNKIYTLHIL